MEDQEEAQDNYKGGHGSQDNFSPPLDFSMNNHLVHHHPPEPPQAGDKLSFADVMHFADFGPKFAVHNNQIKMAEEDNYFLRFPVLGERSTEDEGATEPPPPPPQPPPTLPGMGARSENFRENILVDSLVQLQQGCGLAGGVEKAAAGETKNRRKRPRTMKTTEEVESQRMTHIAVERNRRKQMNEHLRVLRSLMPGSYVHRGDQASIIGGAIEFVRELEQLLQCLESQKRRRVYGGGDQPPLAQPQPPPPPFFPPPAHLPGVGDDPMKLLEYDGNLREDTAETKSSLADVEVKVLGFDAVIKILSRRRPGQLLRTIAALEELPVDILHTNITTIEQTVLYSFNVKITGETRFSAEEVANSVQQIFSFINANTL